MRGERLRVTPLEACIMLVNEINYGHPSEDAARALHGDYWENWYNPYGNPPPLTPADILHDAQRSQLLIERVDQALATLPDQNQLWTRRRFGFDGEGIKTLDEVGAEFGRTKERVRQVTTKALRILRHPSRSKLFREFLP